MAFPSHTGALARLTPVTAEKLPRRKIRPRRCLAKSMSFKVFRYDGVKVGWLGHSFEGPIHEHSAQMIAPALFNDTDVAQEGKFIEHLEAQCCNDRIPINSHPEMIKRMRRRRQCESLKKCDERSCIRRLEFPHIEHGA